MSYTLIIDVCGVRISILSLARVNHNSNPKTVSKSQIRVGICINT